MSRDKAANKMKKPFFAVPIWSILLPLFAWLVYTGGGIFYGSIYLFISVIALIGGVITSVYHAEIIAHRVGEPFGTLVLAVAVTLIEVALIVSLMISGGASAVTLARDAVFAAVMIILNGIIGLCLLLGAMQHKEQTFGLDAVSASLTTLTAIVTLTLILPNYTTSSPGPVYVTSQLIFIAIVSLVLYGTFVLVQAVRHRHYFLPEGEKNAGKKRVPTAFASLISLILLLACLGVVVLLAKKLSPDIENAIIKSGAPNSLVGIIIAGIILVPEGVAAVRAARRNRLQISMNLALGSALASIGLTIPSVAVVSMTTGLTLELGIDIKSTLLLLLSLFVISFALRTGKTTVLQGIVLLVIFSVYLFITIVP
jgi:Ca2+:H+ antiporter